MKQSHYLRSHFFISYILILFTLLITSIPLYFLSKYSLIAMTKNQTKYTLTQIQTNIDIRLKELESVSFYIQHYNELIDLINLRDSKKLPYQLYKTAQEMKDFKLINNLIKEVYIFVKDFNYIFSSSGATPCIEPIYNGMFNYMADNYTEFNNLIWQSNFNNSLKVFFSSISNKNNVNIIFLDTIYISASSPLLICIQIDTNFINNLIKEIDIGKEGATYIVDQNENVISHVGQDILLETDNYLVTTVESPYTGWKYYTILSNNYIFKNIIILQIFIVLIVISVLLIGAFLSYIWTKKNKHSLMNVFNVLTPLSNHTAYKCELYYLEDTITSLVQKYHLIEESSNKQIVLLQQLGLRQLLLGQTDFNTSIHHELNNLISISMEKKFLLLCFNSLIFIEETIYTEVKFYINQTISNINFLEFTEVQMSKSQYIMLLSMDKLIPNENILGELKIVLSNTYEQIKQIYSSEIYFYISDFHIGLSNIHLAYKQIDYMQQLHSHCNTHYGFNCNHKIINILDLPERQDLYYYPISFEIDLLNLLKDSSSEALSLLLKKIYDENILHRNLSPNMYNHLILALRLTLIRCLQETDNSESHFSFIEQIKEVNNLEDLFSLIWKIHNLFNPKDLNQFNSYHLLKKEIEQYMLLHYKDPNFSIHDISKKFKMSTSSIYVFFKNHMPTSFAQLLEKIRIEKACALLLEKNLTINEISEQVGYTNDTSFRRAFKRVLGITPSMYIKLNSS